MKKYIRSVVLICALNGVGVWAEAPCATKIIDPDFGPWPAKESLADYFLFEPRPFLPSLTTCVRSRDRQTCGRGDSVGSTGYYCNNGPKRHHKESTSGILVGQLQPCPHPGKTPVNSELWPTKVLSKEPCVYYNNP
jgi:hypothetical protein